MSSDGKDLERLVAFVEETLLPSGFEVKTNRKVFDDDGNQVAEFDVEISGSIGTTAFSWLIECRDRPSSGAAPGSWIEQLVGRRDRFGFHKVTAVSTTGFASGAAEYAKARGIELREVDALEPEAFSDWLVIQHFTQRNDAAMLSEARIIPRSGQGQALLDSLAQVIGQSGAGAKILRSVLSNEQCSTADVYLQAAKANGEFNEDVPPFSREFSVMAKFSETDYYVIDTPLGAADIAALGLRGTLSRADVVVPLIETSEYRREGGGGVISQVAKFEPQVINGVLVSFEMHKLAETGETHLILRPV